MRIFFFLLSIFYFCTSPLHASQPNDTVLANHPTWQGLLHLKNSHDQLEESRIQSPSFFFKKNGGTSEDELALTLRAFRGQQHGVLPQAAVCKFPARYLWLKDQVELSPSLSILNCPNFVKWADPSNLSSISINHVGSYLGNPASTFGHVLIRFHSKDEGVLSNSLLDPSINFGARVPPKESSVQYIFKGLFGGYTAGFSAQNYYRHDLVYGNTEQRDIWQYNLALTDEQRQLFVAHLWEIREVEFSYYFLLKNCAYRIAEILEPILETKLLPKYAAWYAPAALFHTMSDTKNPSTLEPLVKNIDFIPSQQRSLYSTFRSLTSSEQTIANRIIEDLLEGNTPTLTSLSPLKADRRAAVLDFLVDYSEYEQISSDLKTSLLAARFRLPATKSITQIESIPPPAAGTPNNRVQLGYALKNGSVNTTRFSFSPFFYDRLGRHSDLGSELIFFDFTIDSDEFNNTALSEVSFLKIRKLNSRTPGISGESQSSWIFDTGLKRDDECLTCSDFFIRGGIGRSTYLSSNIQAWAFGTGNLVPEDRLASLGAEIGVLFTTDKQGISIQGNQSILQTRGSSQTSYEINYRYQLSPQVELRLEAENKEGNTVSAGLAYFF